MQKLVLGGICVGIALIVILVLRVVTSDITQNTDFVYHALLADPKIYKNGTYSETFQISAGNYKFKFIPNGDSPKMLSIKLQGEQFLFSKKFDLHGTSHKSPTFEYFTWDYLGHKEFQIIQGQTLKIIINPNGNIAGSVSVLIEQI